MGNENDPVAVANLETLVNRTCLNFAGCPARSEHSIQGEAPVKWCFCCLNRERCFRHEVEHPVHDRFTALRRDFMQGPAASDRDQKEQAPAHYRKGLQEFVNCWQIISSFPCHQGIDLNRQAEFSRFARHLYRPVEASRDRTYGIVPSGIGTVEA
jgi:hypothetical protein